MSLKKRTKSSSNATTSDRRALEADLKL